MSVARFDPGGGPIKVAVSCVPSRNGSYTIILWEANANEVVKKYPGNFLNTADDEYSLDRPNSAHEGRLLEGMIVVAIPPGVGPSTVSMAVTQDSVELAKESGSVAPGSTGQLVDLFIELQSR
jgi:hypothetical protein